MRVTGVIQAGGRSTRMGGEPKALMTVGGQPIIERVMRAVAPAVDDLLIVTNTPDLYAFLGLPMIPDALPDHGSLGWHLYGSARSLGGRRLYGGVRHAVSLSGGGALGGGPHAGHADVVIPRVGGQLQALHALYTKACLPHVEERLRAGRLKIAGFFESVRVLEIDEEELVGVS